MGCQVFCVLSTNIPKGFALRSLRHASDQRERQVYQVEEDDFSVAFPLFSFSCGYCAFVGDHLAYTPEVQWPDSGTLKFKNRNTILKLKRSVLVRIPLNTIMGFVWSRNGSLTLTMSTVPLFFDEKDAKGPGGKRARLCSLSESHAKVVGQCLVYQFKVSPVDLFQKMQQLKGFEITITYYEHVAWGTGSFVRDYAAFMGILSTYTQNNYLPSEILFQLQALVDNAYLLPSTVLNLAMALRGLYRADRMAGKRPISVDAMKKLFVMIDWSYPYRDPADFQAESLVEALKESQQEIQDGYTYRQGLVTPGRNLARINRVISWSLPPRSRCMARRWNPTIASCASSQTTMTVVSGRSSATRMAIISTSARRSATTTSSRGSKAS